MIQIIKKGTKKIEECPTCGCVFSYERVDLCMDPISREWIINCPQCSKAIKVFERKDTEFNE